MLLAAAGILHQNVGPPKRAADFEPEDHRPTKHPLSDAAAQEELYKEERVLSKGRVLTRTLEEAPQTLKATPCGATETPTNPTSAMMQTRPASDSRSTSQQSPSPCSGKDSVEVRRSTKRAINSKDALSSPKRKKTAADSKGTQHGTEQITPNTQLKEDKKRLEEDNQRSEEEKKLLISQLERARANVKAEHVQSSAASLQSHSQSATIATVDAAGNPADNSRNAGEEC